MAKAMYKLTVDHPDTAVTVDVIDGKAVLTFEIECDEDDVKNEDSAGDYQGDLLWELFKHDFQTFDDNGTPIKY